MSSIFLFQSFQRFNRICFFDDHPIRTTCPTESWKPGERRGVSKNTSKGSKIGTAGTALISKSLKDFGQSNTICHWIPRVFAQSHWLAAASFLIKGILQAASWFSDFCSDWQQTNYSVTAEYKKFAAQCFDPAMIPWSEYPVPGKSLHQSNEDYT